MSGRKLSMSMRAALLKISLYETPEFGVIIDARIAPALVDRELCESAPRRWYSRTDGVCLRLTVKGREYMA